MRAGALTVLAVLSAAVVSGGCRRESSGTEPGKGDGPAPKGSGRPPALRKENLLGNWRGSLGDEKVVELKFTQQGVVVALWTRTANREAVRELIERMAQDESGVGAANAGNVAVGSMAYEIDADKNEVTLSYFPDKRLAVARPAPGGALLLSGKFKIGNSMYPVPETRIEPVKPGDERE